MTPQQARQAFGDTTTVSTTFLSHFAQMCGKAKERFENDIEFPFDGSWFFHDVDDYNPYMSWAGMAICLSGYKNLPSNGYRYIAKSFANLGCRDIDITSYYHLNDENQVAVMHNVDQLAYAFGHRTVKDAATGEERELVVMMLRGTSDSAEWLSNSEVADSVADGDFSRFTYHEGFMLTARKSLADLKTYIGRHRIDMRGAKLWVIGHSRGAAIANVLAALIDEDTQRPADSRVIGVDRDDFYAYTYSASRGTVRDDAGKPLFANIFNVVNPEDYIPRLPPSGWGIRRFGRDLFLPSIATRYADYRLYRDEFLATFRKWTRMDFPAFHGFAETNALERGLVDLCPTVADMYQHKRFSHGGTVTFSQYFTLFTDLPAVQGHTQDLEAAEFTKYGSGTFSDFLAYFIHNEILGHNASGAHQEEGYLIKLALCCKDDIDIEQGERVDTTCLTVYGPVDIHVLDAAGKPVAVIENGKIDEKLYDSSGFIAMYVDKTTRERSVWIPDGGHYDVRLKARADGHYELLESRIAPSGRMTARTVYADVPLKKNAVVEWGSLRGESRGKPTDRLGTLDVRCSVRGIGELSDGKAFASTYGPGAHTIPIPGPEVVCDARGVRQLSFGDTVAVRAHHGADVKFLGWYRAGDNPKDAAPLSTDESFVFAPTESQDLVAWFEKR
ncbi:lipase family protein [Bifidobacterium choloepi]|uniref:Fungal lipase-type domain-containing protein n=1 Tax=Bifidobacterium choloepi TaxID=2614131 RepID=A0A6I5NKA4_9BIFI|nr:hypothetical protein [Bifidobacterium choloepi]NEG69282.1 hypothetical protein [Bifidobacterium choloepi]